MRPAEALPSSAHGEIRAGKGRRREFGIGDIAGPELGDRAPVEVRSAEVPAVDRALLRIDVVREDAACAFGLEREPHEPDAGEELKEAGLCDIGRHVAAS